MTELSDLVSNPSVGVTGTQTGITNMAVMTFVKIANNICPRSLHHGDCVGADAQIHKVVTSVWPWVGVEIWPPVKSDKRAYCKAPVIHDTQQYLQRNKSIVDHTDVLFAFPDSEEERLRSGTWSTVRYARNNSMPIVIIFPSGKFVMENVK